MRMVISTIYLDNASTTKIDQMVLAEMLPYLRDNYGNASSLHSLGRKSRQAIEHAREQVAKSINAEPNQIFFTSGSTESNNWIISNFNHVLCSKVEHHSILNNPKCTAISFESLPKTIYKQRPDLVTHIFVNNETGQIYNIKEMTVICNKMKVPFHTDSTQAFGHIPIDVKELNVDSLVLSGHKFHAPKSIGILYLKEPNKYKPMLYGGSQEHNLRAGTENVAGIVGIGKACELYNYSPEREKRCKEIQNQFFNAFSSMKDIHFNTDINKSIASTLNVAFKGVESESLMIILDKNGICVSSGSACDSKSHKPSHVLEAIGCPKEYIHNSIRLSWDSTLSSEEVNYVIEIIKKNVQAIRGY